jgi:hypothetical protein
MARYSCVCQGNSRTLSIAPAAQIARPVNKMPIESSGFDPQLPAAFLEFTRGLRRRLVHAGQGESASN